MKLTLLTSESGIEVLCGYCVAVLRGQEGSKMGQESSKMEQAQVDVEKETPKVYKMGSFERRKRKGLSYPGYIKGITVRE